MATTEPHEIEVSALMAKTTKIVTPTMTLHADSGCTQHMTSDRSVLTGIRALSTPMVIGTAGHAKLVATECGTLGILKDVLYVPGISSNLFSVSCAAEKGVVTVFDRHGVSLYSESEFTSVGVPFMTGAMQKGMYNLEFGPQQIDAKAMIADAQTENKAALWHARLGHPSQRRLREMLNKKAVVGVNISKPDFKKFNIGCCEACALGKMCQAPISKYDIYDDQAC